MPDLQNSLPSSPVAKFPMGILVITPNALSQVPEQEILLALARHSIRDWGELDPEDKRTNDRAVDEGTRLLSSYKTISGLDFWIITEWDRSVTTILLPEDY